MKKIAFITFASLFLGSICYSQQNDDRLVTAHLPVNSNEQKYVSFLAEFKAGLQKVKNRELSTSDEISRYYGVDIRTCAPLNTQLSAASSPGYSGQISPAFISRLSQNIQGVGTTYRTVQEFRNAMVDIATGLPLTVKEVEALTLIDLATQEVDKQFMLSAGVLSLYKGSDFLSNRSGPFAYVDELNGDDKLPKWLRCTLSIIGGGIVGALNGALAGGQIGALFAGVGAPLGATIGAVGGGIAGVATAITQYCD